MSGVAGAAIDDDPAGLVPTGATLAKVRALYDHAYPREHTRNATIIEDWRLFQDGVVGSYHVNRLGRDERATTTLGPLTYARGVLHGVHWEQNRNGIVFTYSGIHELRDAISDRALHDSVDDRDVRLLGESVPLDAYVVEVNPPSGRHEWYYVEKRSGYLVRREMVQRRRRYVTSYDDYHLVDGLPEPSRVRTVDSLGNEREQILVNRTLDDTPDLRDVDMPASRRVVEFPDKPTTIRLPARFVNGLAIVRVIVGRGAYDFLLDSGAAGIIVDPTIVEQGDLERYGNRIGATIGTFPESTTIVPQMTIGPLRMRNVVARIVPVPFHPDPRTHIAGLLGFDFFADSVVHFEPSRGLVEAINPDGFRPPNDTTAVQLALDDKTATIRARAGGTLARVVVDTGSNRTIFESAFADRADFAPDDSATLQRLRGIGGFADAAATRIPLLDVGGIQTHDATVEVSNTDLGADDLDGIMGTDLLRSYELWLDFPSNTMYLRRGKR
ncbi:MAG TPA: retroviral-like aspartic protease family protein [Candidatus Limnocylindria bacterium]|nr:retroviral-like aspartic protease family protein [Candidatus Limnocylindria bacterium]